MHLSCLFAPYSAVRRSLLTGALALTAAWSATAQSVSVINFHGDSVTATQKLRGANPTVTPLDLDADGSADDSTAGYAFSATTALSPSSGYTGPRFFGGVRGEALNVNNKSFDGRDVANATTQDYLEVRYQANTAPQSGRLFVTVFFDKADFASGNTSADVVKFAADSALSVNLLKFENLSTARWLVRDGTQFYVSQASFTASATLSFTSATDDGAWAPFDPATSLNFDQANAAFSSRDFQNITAVGLIIDKDAYSAVRHWLQLRTFTATVQVSPVVVNVPPTARLTATPTNGSLPLAVAFDGSASTDTDGTLTSYAWNFGDGTTGSGATANHTYTAAGSYTASLTVTDNSGATSTATRAINVVDGSLATVVSFGGDMTTTSPSLRNGAPTVTVLDLDADGAVDDSTAEYLFSSTTALSPTSNYTGTRFFGGFRSEGLNGTALSIADRTITNSASADYLNLRYQANGVNQTGRIFGVVYFDKSDFAAGGATLPVKFDYRSRLKITSPRLESLGEVRWLVRNGTQFYVSEALVSSGGQFTFANNTDDGRWATFDPVTSLNFDAAGATFATRDFNDVTAVGLLFDKDAYSTARTWLNLSGLEVQAFVGQSAGTYNEAPTASFTATPNPVKRPNAVVFNGTGSTDPESGTLSYAWNFGDGATATGATTSHAYAANGTYNATLVVTDPYGNSSVAAARTITVLSPNVAPVASFTATPTLGEAPLLVNVDASASSDSDGTVASYQWAFGDGATATGVTASHTYTQGGEYIVTLTITDNDGASHQTTRTVRATVNGTVPPTASFTAAPTNGVAPLLVAFDASGSYDPDGTIVTYAWTFGDGASGSGVSPSHTYTVPGSYVATLTVTDNSGGTRQATRTIAVRDPNQTGPTDNPVATMYGAGAYPWTDEINWTNVFNIQDFPGTTDMERYMAARDAAAAAGGGVVYFPAGTYTFTSDLYLTNGVVIRGETPSQLDAKAGNFDPPTKFVFPQFVPLNSGTGTDPSTAFKQIFTLSGNTDSNLGLVYIDVNRARINLQGNTDTGTNRNVLVFGVRSNNTAANDGSIPKTAFQNAWQRWPNRFAANIKIQVLENTLVANCRLNDAPTDSYEMPGYIVEDTTKSVGDPARYVTLTGPQARFDYTEHYGIYVNRGASVTYGTPSTAPSLFRTGVVIRDNWVYCTQRVKIHASGQGLIIADNVLRDDSNKARWISPTGDRLVQNAATLENRGIDWAGHNVVIVGNDVQVARHRLKEGPYYSVDGEGILLQECCGGTSIRGVLIEDNIVNSYIGLYKTREIEDAIIRNNTITNATGALADLIYVNADTNGTNYYVKNVLIEGNTLNGNIRLEGDGAGGGTGNVIQNNTGNGTIAVSNAANATLTNNPGFSVTTF